MIIVNIINILNLILYVSKKKKKIFDNLIYLLGTLNIK